MLNYVFFCSTYIQEEGTEWHQGDSEVCSEGHGNHRRQGRREAEQASTFGVDRGIRSVPRRVRVRIARRRNDEEDAKDELYSLVTVTEVPPEGSQRIRH